MKINYLLNGTPVNPVNREDIYLEVNHDQQAVINQPAPHVGINNLYFAREDVKRIMQFLNQSPGITEGIPFDIQISERGQTETINMYIDFMDGLSKSKDGFSATVKMLQSLDWLDDKVDAFTFESLYNETNVPTFYIDNKSYGSYKQFFDERKIYVPYVISTIPNWQDAFLAMFAMVYIATQLYNTMKMIVQWITPTPGIGVTISVGQFAIEIIYALLLIATLTSLLTQLINCLIQPVKYHGAMLISDLLKITAVKLGLQSQSSVWDAYPFNQVALLPEKYEPPKATGNIFSLMGFNVGGYSTSGYTSPSSIQTGYFNGTGGDLLRLVKTICNGKIIIPDQTNILKLERRDYFPASTLYQLPDIRQDWNGYNTDELTANILISFTPDLNDKNCIDKYTGTQLQATHQQITTVNNRLVCLKGLREINIAAARGINKTELTFAEKVVRDIENVWHYIIFVEGIVSTVVIDGLILAANIIIAALNVAIAVFNLMVVTLGIVTDIINTIIAGINAIPGVPDITPIDDFTESLTFDYVSFISFQGFQDLQHSDFSNRINALLLENDMLDVPKLLLVDTQRTEFANSRIAYLHTDNQTVINAQYLWDKFYFIDAFTGTPNNRFTKISPALNKDSEHNPVMLSLADFKSLVSNPQFKDNWNETVIADSIQWHIEKNGTADFAFRKAGWLRDPQNTNGIKRAQEIALNLKIQITVPNGQ